MWSSSCGWEWKLKGRKSEKTRLGQRWETQQKSCIINANLEDKSELQSLSSHWETYHILNPQRFAAKTFQQLIFLSWIFHPQNFLSRSSLLRKGLWISRKGSYQRWEERKSIVNTADKEKTTNPGMIQEVHHLAIPWEERVYSVKYAEYSVCWLKWISPVLADIKLFWRLCSVIN